MCIAAAFIRLLLTLERREYFSIGALKLAEDQVGSSFSEQGYRGCFGMVPYTCEHAAQVNWQMLWADNKKRNSMRILGYLVLAFAVLFPVGIFTGGCLCHQSVSAAACVLPDHAVPGTFDML